MLATVGLEIVAITVADPPALRVTLEALREADKPAGATEIES